MIHPVQKHCTNAVKTSELDPNHITTNCELSRIQNQVDQASIRQQISDIAVTFHKANKES